MADGDVLTIVAGHQAFAPLAARLLGPFPLTFDQTDLPGTSQLYALSGFGVWGEAVSGSFDLVADGQAPVTLPYNATLAQVQAALRGVVGADNVDCFDPGDIDPGTAGRTCYVLFTGDLDYTAVSLGVENDTTDTTVVTATEFQAGNAMPRLGRELFTPRVGDVILGLFAAISVPFLDAEMSGASAYYGDYSRLDPTLVGDVGAPGLFGDNSQYLPVSDLTYVEIGAFSKIPAQIGGMNSNGYWSADMDRSKWDSMFSVVRRAVPFSVAITKYDASPFTPTQGSADLYVQVATPVLP